MTFRRATAADRPVAWLWFAASASAVALLPFASWITPFLPGCALREWTGWPCPTCGATRATVALARFRVGEAMGLNPLAAVSVLLFLAGGLLAPAWVARRAPLPVATGGGSRRWKLALLATILANWAYLVVAGV